MAPSSPKSPSLKPTPSPSVTLYTWGTHDNGGSGVAQFLDASFFLGNVGHTSLEISVPANQQGQAWIDKYCLKNGKPIIPYERISRTIMGPDGKPIQEDFFNIYFSWWPADKEDVPFELHRSLNTDRDHERLGVDTPSLAPRFQTPGGIQQEKRAYRGPLGTKVRTLAPTQIVHARDRSPDELQLFEVERQIDALNQDIDAITRLEHKMRQAKSGTLSVKGSTLALLNRFTPHWQALADSHVQLNPEHQIELEKFLTLKKEAMKEEKVSLVASQSELFARCGKKQSKKLDKEVSALIAEANALPELSEATCDQLQEKYSPQAWMRFQIALAKKDFENFLHVLTFVNHHEPDIVQQAVDAGVFPPDTTPETQQALKNWRTYCPKGYEPFSPLAPTEQARAAFLQVLNQAAPPIQSKILRLTSEYSTLYQKQDPMMYQAHESFVTLGLDADNVVPLPTRGMPPNGSSNKGLDVEKMLIKMRELVDTAESFELALNNCSTTSADILHAGAEPELRSYFHERAMGTFGTPQVVLNGAQKYKHAIYNHDGKQPFSEKLSRFNPLNMITSSAGKLLRKYVDPNTGPLASMLLSPLVIGMGILAGAATLIKAVIKPDNSYQQCKRFISYANQSPSRFLKICAVPTIAMAGVLVLPAKIQQGVTKLVQLPKKLKKGTKKRSAKQTDLPIAKDNLVEINESDPEAALERLHNIISTQEDVVPVFAQNIQHVVVAYVHNLKRADPVQQVRSENYEKDIKAAFQRFKNLQKKSELPFKPPKPVRTV